jgi:hypothetical protein
MQSLFSRADSWLLKDEVSPATPGNIVAKLMAVKGANCHRKSEIHGLMPYIWQPQKPDTRIQTEFLYLAIAIVGFSLVLYFMLMYFQDKRRTRSLEMQKMEMDSRSRLEQQTIAEKLAARNSAIMDQQRAETQLLFEKLQTELKRQAAKNDPGGFIVFDLPQQHHSAFHDMLKGFEEFARLKGYNIAFSIDSSDSNTVAFKFTILDTGISVSTASVRKDVQEYILKIKEGDDFTSMPQVLNSQEHDLILATLKNRIKFLQYNYELEKNSKEYLLKLMQEVGRSSNGIAHTPTIYIQTGGHNAGRHLLANNSNQVLLGDDNERTNNVDNSLVIKNSFNERKQQLEKIDQLISILEADQKLTQELRQELVVDIAKIREELHEEPEPSATRIGRWINNIKRTAERAVFTHESVQALQWLYAIIS